MPLIVQSVIIKTIFKTSHLIIPEEGTFLAMKTSFRLGQLLLIFPFPGIMTLRVDSELVPKIISGFFHLKYTSFHAHLPYLQKWRTSSHKLIHQL